jgi:hypothetical protein
MWAQSWAWLGLAGLAVPIAIHLLAKHQAIRAAFPTLRFIDASELNAIKRQRLTDIPLLLVRMLMIALAVAAIAGPRFGSGAAAREDEPARATVYDMTISAASGRSDAVVDGPRPRRATIEAESLHAGLEAAAAWVSRQSGQRDITVVSDFQRGAMDAGDLALVPSGVGLHFERVRSTPAPMPAGLTRDDGRVRMVWPAQSAHTGPIVVKAGPDQALADSLLAAVTNVIPFEDNPEEPSAIIVFPKAPERAALVKSMVPIDQPWMFLVTKELLSKTPNVARVGSVRPDPLTNTLAVVMDVSPDTTDALNAVASIARGLAAARPASESETRTIDDATLRSWERAAQPNDLRRAGEPQGRWLWMAVVLALVIETGMRRRAA